MKPVLTVKLESDPLERIRAEVIVVGVAPTDRPLRGGAGYADWRLCGGLWKLVSSGRISGARGQASLVIPGGGLQTRLLLVLGLGPRHSLTISEWQEFGRDAIDRSMGLRAETVALAIVQDAFVDRPTADRSTDGRSTEDRSTVDRERIEAVGGLISGAANAVLARRTGLGLAILGSSLTVPEATAVPAGVEVRLLGSVPSH